MVTLGVSLIKLYLLTTTMDSRGPMSKKDIKDYKSKDLMTKDVVILLPRDNLLNAQNKMSRYRIKKIIVVDEKNKRHPVGILTIKNLI